ncbi:unnamed protein product [Linum trigynum]|uniref:Uncharacterized protein n=1 Tax=Linum trigynum TaxID=586398 RepID=A0AAV2DS54_9ROSI
MNKENITAASTVERLQNDLAAARKTNESLTSARDKAHKEVEAWAAKLATGLAAEQEKVRTKVEPQCLEHYVAQAVASQAEAAEVERRLRERLTDLASERERLQEEVDTIRVKARQISEENKRVKRSKEQYKKELKEFRAEEKRLTRDLAEYHKFEVGKNLQADAVIDTVKILQHKFSEDQPEVEWNSYALIEYILKFMDIKRKTSDLAYIIELDIPPSADDGAYDEQALDEEVDDDADARAEDEEEGQGGERRQEEQQEDHQEEQQGTPEGSVRSEED